MRQSTGTGHHRQHETPRRTAREGTRQFRPLFAEGRIPCLASPRGDAWAAVRPWCKSNGWPPGRPCAVIFWLSGPALPLIARRTTLSRRTPVSSAFQPRRGRTSDCGSVTPTARLASVSSRSATSISGSAMPSRRQAPLSSRVVRRSREPRAPLGKERLEHTGGEAMGDKFAWEKLSAWSTRCEWQWRSRSVRSALGIGFHQLPFLLQRIEPGRIKLGHRREQQSRIGVLR
jgi:hypothetical protein